MPAEAWQSPSATMSFGYVASVLTPQSMQLSDEVLVRRAWKIGEQKYHSELGQQWSTTIGVHYLDRGLHFHYIENANNMQSKSG